ncbi:TPM domain-containing protein [Xylophilus rhododendri]|uniref:TPM domain-containing protein n=1 Tax=Xylophilus rhododendri TaxID=2697032 RepID=A0A857J554_9BURK|nr:TPM domain-containing protein [Xylophilus rhododendri]QHI99114.1 TPM domain-containing protein [Xylophilus rhododendri]
MANLFSRLIRIVRHRWRDEGHIRKAIPPDLVARLQQRVAESERRHTGQIRLCIEAGLPTSYLWRGATPRERAVMLFGKLRVWDTEENNGVLVYLLLADHAIEIVADRGLNRHVGAGQWQHLVAHMGDAFGAGRYEDGLTQALDDVGKLLAAYFPAPDDGSMRPNELPDAPVLQGDLLLD